MTPKAREALRKAATTLDLFAREEQRITDEWGGMSAARKDRVNRESHRRFASVCRGLAIAARQIARQREPDPEPPAPPEPPPQEPE